MFKIGHSTKTWKRRDLRAHPALFQQMGSNASGCQVPPSFVENCKTRGAVMSHLWPYLVTELTLKLDMPSSLIASCSFG
jgi:hypothetical protein